MEFVWFGEKEAEGDLIAPYGFLSGEGGADLFSGVRSARVRGNGSKLCLSQEVGSALM